MALRKERSPEAVGSLIAALGDPDANIRWLAALTLESIGGEAVIVRRGRSSRRRRRRLRGRGGEGIGEADSGKMNQNGRRARQDAWNARLAA